MRFTSTKWPRWLVPNWVSKPSAVCPKGVRITPALAMGPPVSHQRVGTGAHALERGEIQLHQLQSAAVCRLRPDLGRRPLRLGEVARGADHLGSMRREGAGGLDPK